MKIRYNLCTSAFIFSISSNNSGDGNGDRDKDKDKDDNNRSNQNGDDEKEEEEEKKEENDEENMNKLFEILNNIDEYDDKQLLEALSNLSQNTLPRLLEEMEKMKAEVHRLYRIFKSQPNDTLRRLAKEFKDKENLEKIQIPIPKVEKIEKKRSSDIKSNHIQLSIAENISKTDSRSLTINRSNKRRQSTPEPTYGRYLSTYDAPKPNKFRISRQFSTNILPSKIREKISDCYSYMIKSLHILEEDQPLTEQTSDNGEEAETEMKVMDLNLHNQEDEKIYLIATKPDRNKRWQLLDKIFTENLLFKKYNIEPDAKLIQSTKDKNLMPSKDLLDEIGKKLKEIQHKKIIHKTQWHKIPIFAENASKRKMLLLITKEEFKKDFTNFVKQRDEEIYKVIPIVMFDINHKYFIEYIWIITIDRNCDIGIGFSYDQHNKDINVNGIHLNKVALIKQHELVSSKHMMDCKCFDEFRSNISDLSIGNVKEKENKIKQLQKQLDRLKVQINTMNALKSQIETLKKENKALRTTNGYKMDDNDAANIEMIKLTSAEDMDRNQSTAL